MKKLILFVLLFTNKPAISQHLNSLLRPYYDTTVYISDTLIDESYTLRSKINAEYKLLFFRDKYDIDFKAFNDLIQTSPLTIVLVENKTGIPVFHKKFNYNLVNGLYNDSLNIFISLITYNMNPYYQGEVFRFNISEYWYDFDKIFNFSTMSYYCYNKKNRSFLCLDAIDQFDPLIGNKEKYRLIEYKADSSEYSTGYIKKYLGVTKFKYDSPYPGGTNSATNILNQIKNKEKYLLSSKYISDYTDF